MSGRLHIASSSTFALEDFLRRLDAYVIANPRAARRAFVAAGQRIRVESARPENSRRRIQLQLIARDVERRAEAEAPPGLLSETGYASEAVAVDESSADLSLEAPFYFDEGVEEGVETEYDALVADMAAAKVGPDGLPRTGLGEAQAFQQLQAARSALVALPVQATPISARPGSTVFSDQVLVQYGGTAGSGSYTSATSGMAGAVVASQEAPVVRWDGREQESMVCTVALYRVEIGSGATFPGISGGTLNFRPFARVSWGVDRGRPCEALVDIGRGVQISVAASFLYVNVGMEAPAPGTQAGSMWLGGSLGFFASGRGTPATRTIYVDSLGAHNNQLLIIPQFATTIQALHATNASLFTGQIKDAQGNQIGVYVPSSTTSGVVTLPDDAYYLQLTNTSDSAASCEVVFGLSL